MDRADKWFKVLVLSAGIGITAACGTVSESEDGVNGLDKGSVPQGEDTDEKIEDNGTTPGSVAGNSEGGSIPNSCLSEKSYDDEKCENDVICKYDGVLCCWTAWEFDAPQGVSGDFFAHCNMCASDLGCGTTHMPFDLDCRES